MPKKIGQLIKERRKKLEKIQSWLANELGVTKGLISEWERGNTLVQEMYIEKLSETLEVSPEILLQAILYSKASQKTQAQQAENRSAVPLTLAMAFVDVKTITVHDVRLVSEKMEQSKKQMRVAEIVELLNTLRNARESSST